MKYCIDMTLAERRKELLERINLHTARVFEFADSLLQNYMARGNLTGLRWAFSHRRLSTLFRKRAAYLLPVGDGNDRVWSPRCPQEKRQQIEQLIIANRLPLEEADKDIITIMPEYAGCFAWHKYACSKFKNGDGVGPGCGDSYKDLALFQRVYIRGELATRIFNWLWRWEEYDSAMCALDDDESEAAIKVRQEGQAVAQEGQAITEELRKRYGNLYRFRYCLDDW